MDHRTQIHQGVLQSSISHLNETPLYGLGQGSGAGVINWHSHNEALIAMYDQMQPGCLTKSPVGKSEIHQKVISYVDDSKLIQAFPW